MTIPALPVYNPALLAKTLREQGLPGRRSKTAIIKLRRERRERRGWRTAETEAAVPVDPRVYIRPALIQRVNARILARYRAEITRRGGETSIEGKYGATDLAITSRSGGLTLLTAEGWRAYGRQPARTASLAYLCGHEDGQVWAVRVPATIGTAQGALDWLTPAAVRDAQAAGRRVERQGDLYAIETTRAHDGRGELPDRHTWDPRRRVLSHPEHGELHLPHPVRFVPQRPLPMGRMPATTGRYAGTGSRRRYGD